MASVLDPAHLMGHVKDATYFEVPRAIDPDSHLELPDTKTEVPIVPANKTLHFEAFDLKLTKFMVLEAVAALIVAMVFIVVANKVAKGGGPRGRFLNMFEAMLVFIRDQVARPAIGHHDADRFLPFLWTMFFFILTCNLLGMVPWAGSATGALGTTLALAMLTFGAVVMAGSAKLGVVGFWKAQVPHMDLPGPMGLVMKPGIFGLEVIGLIIRHGVLAVRLLANMFAGHLVLAVILAFIGIVEGAIWWGVMPASILGAVALSLLELFVAFLQAYVFTYLSALFIGMAVHPH
jgi:F-type H+-transporting ATPase subunit a